MNPATVTQRLRDDPRAVQQSKEALERMLARSATDRAFRERLLEDPRAAVAEFTGKPVSEIPESFNLRFVENTAGATIVLPDFADPTAELSESELETVSGGTTTLPCLGLVIALLTLADTIQDHY